MIATEIDLDQDNISNRNAGVLRVQTNVLFSRLTTDKVQALEND